MATKVDVATGSKRIEILATCIILIKPNTTVALDTSVHFVIDEGAQILISVRPLFESKSSVRVTRHNRHILEMARSSLVTNSAVVWMVCHQPFDDMFPKLHSFMVLDRDPLIVCHWFHA
ncbi:MAG TPA: hypothetical protein VJM08_14415 [Anaerolineales bacterium]|nr:hypothetical protein [Anaerolineales bacterium]